jgi:hypothetical protein
MDNIIIGYCDHLYDQINGSNDLMNNIVLVNGGNNDDIHINIDDSDDENSDDEKLELNSSIIQKDKHISNSFNLDSSIIKKDNHNIKKDNSKLDKNIIKKKHGKNESSEEKIGFYHSNTELADFIKQL